MHEGDTLEADMLPLVLLHGTTSRAPQENAATDGSSMPYNPYTASSGNKEPLSEVRNSSQIRSLAEVEKRYIEQAISACGNNIPRAAAMLGISPSTIYRKKTGWEHGGKNIEENIEENQDISAAG